MHFVFLCFLLQRSGLTYTFTGIVFTTFCIFIVIDLRIFAKVACLSKKLQDVNVQIRETLMLTCIYF